MIRGLFLLGGLGALGYGVYRYYNSQVAILEDSDIDLVNVKLINQTKTNITLRFNFTVTNNSEQTFTIKEYKIGVYFNQKFIGDIQNSELDKQIKSGGGKTNISFDFSFNPQSIGLADVLSGIIIRRLQSVITLRGRFVVKKGFFSVNSPLDINYTLKEFL